MERRFKGSNNLIETKFLSAKGLFVAEAEQTDANAPIALEAADVEAKVATRVGVHARHPVVTVGVFPEGFFLVERSVVAPLGQFTLALLVRKRSALSASEDRSLTLEESETIFRSNSLVDPENPAFQPLARHELGRHLGVIR